MAPHSITLAWKIPWMEEPGRLQSMGLLRVGHDWAIYFHFSLSCIGEGNGNPLQCSCLENPRGRGAWWAAVYGIPQSQTRLKWLSSSSSRISKKIWMDLCSLIISKTHLNTFYWHAFKDVNNIQTPSGDPSIETLDSLNKLLRAHQLRLIMCGLRVLLSVNWGTALSGLCLCFRTDPTWLRSITHCFG